MTDPGQTASWRRRWRLLLAIAFAAVLTVATAAATGSAPGQSLEQRLDETQSQLSQTQSREGVLTTKISHESAQIDSLQSEVAALRERTAALAAELAEKQAALDRAVQQLEILRARLQESIRVLEARLIVIYKSNEPDELTVLLQADGFDDLLTRAEYLEALNDADEAIVGEVRGLRDEMQSTVNTVRAARDQIAAQKAELDANRVELQQRTVELAAARKQQQATLIEVRSRQKDLEGDLSAISAKIQERLAALAGPTLPAGPIRPGSGDMIWPVNGTITSGFGPRWGRMHEGLDIAAPGGTPIRAAKAGTIVIASPNGGYGNYTCIDHGGGQSTCYAHQQGFARTSGPVSQGTVIGYVGSTGESTGNHLHFEVRINGQAVDPLSYL